MKSVILALLLFGGIAFANDGRESDAGNGQTLAETAPMALCFDPKTPSDYVEKMTGLGVGTDKLGNGAKTKGAGEEEGDDGGAYAFQLTGRWTATATNGGGLAQGDPTVLTWSYMPDGVFIPSAAPGLPSGFSNLQVWLNGLYGSQATWHALFQQVFDRWSEVTGVTYVYEPNDDGASFNGSPGVLGVRGDVRVGAMFVDGNSNILAYNYFPAFGGDMVIDSADNFFNDLSNNSLKFRNVVAHEHGHGLGLRHVCPVSETKLMEPFASTAFDGPQLDDILGAQRHYGDPFEHNDTAATATSLGIIYPTNTVDVDVVSIDDNSDANYYAFTVGAGQMTSITLDPPMVSSYRQGPQNSNGTCPSFPPFYNPNTIHDLGFDLIDTDGVTVLASVNANGLGMGESLVNAPLLSGYGTYYVRVFGSAANSVQAYNLSVTVNRCRAGYAYGGWNLPRGATNGWVGDYLFEGGGFVYKFAATLVWTSASGGTINGTLYDGVAPDQDYDVVGTYTITDVSCGRGTFQADILLPGTTTVVGSISGSFSDDPNFAVYGMNQARWEICD